MSVLIASLISLAFAGYADFDVHEFCQEVCRATPGCRTDPHAHGSYCKIDHNPQTCFGLFFRAKSGRLCFQPNEKDRTESNIDFCDESKPVLCKPTTPPTQPPTTRPTTKPTSRPCPGWPRPCWKNNKEDNYFEDNDLPIGSIFGDDDEDDDRIADSNGYADSDDSDEEEPRKERVYFPWN
jgi:hypothetical protein